jgi:hypothetical protein
MRSARFILGGIGVNVFDACGAGLVADGAPRAYFLLPSLL